jgi:hypothetical protein
MSALDELRADPDKASEKYDFFVDFRGFTNTAIPGEKNCQRGGACTLTQTGTTNGVTRLKMNDGGTDYAFPWVNRGVGEVRVPKLAPDGTVVVTGGMNGCALVVTDDGDHYNFYHDADSCQLGTLKAAEGNEVCKIGTKTYMPMSMGEKIIGRTIGDGSAYLHQMLTVRHRGGWRVYSFGIIIGPGIDMNPKQTFRDSATKLMVTFD